jgi:hypothetical protein
LKTFENVKQVESPLILRESKVERGIYCIKIQKENIIKKGGNVYPFQEKGG